MTTATAKIYAAMPVKSADRVGYRPATNPTEYPLFTQQCADDCPTARYVGGVSRWLCECSDPAKCQGVRRARLNADGVTITRREYMADCGGEDSFEKFTRYTGQFVTASVIQGVISCIGIDAIMNSKDKHFNDIPLANWDRIGLPSDAARLVALANTFTYAPGTAPGLSLSDQVSINKAAARVIQSAGLTRSEYGTSHFASKADAVSYYAAYGDDAAAVDQKIEAGEISIGKPETKTGEKLKVNREGRYVVSCWS